MLAGLKAPASAGNFSTGFNQAGPDGIVRTLPGITARYLKYSGSLTNG
jgi:hypothetical protein